MLVYNANELEGEDPLTVSLLTSLVHDIQLNVSHAPETRSRMSPCGRDPSRFLYLAEIEAA